MAGNKVPETRPPHWGWKFPEPVNPVFLAIGIAGLAIRHRATPPTCHRPARRSGRITLARTSHALAGAGSVLAAPSAFRALPMQPGIGGGAQSPWHDNDRRHHPATV